ncbi:MAG: hypothetical protein AAFX87_12280 [Bacteroidota bacterium]
MIKPLLLIGTLLFSQYFQLNAQHTEQLDYIVLNNGDSIYGAVAYINENEVNRGFYKKVRLTDANGKTKKYKRESISSFRVNGNEYRSFWLYQPLKPFHQVHWLIRDTTWIPNKDNTTF